MGLVGLKGAHYHEMDWFPINKWQDVRRVKREIAGTQADNNGAINVWIDIEGQYRCEAHKFKNVIDSKIFKDRLGAEKWVKEFLIKIK